MDSGPTLTRTVDLGYEQMLLVESHPRTRIKVIYGGIWLTEEGRTQDVFASSGDEVTLKSHGLAVVEGLGYARVQVLEAPALLSRWIGAVRSTLYSAVTWFRSMSLAQRTPARSQPAA
jgi:hypothetical protein